jgi:hypothetical protein
MKCLFRPSRNNSLALKIPDVATVSGPAALCSVYMNMAHDGPVARFCIAKRLIVEANEAIEDIYRLSRPLYIAEQTGGPDVYRDAKAGGDHERQYK